MGVMRMKEPLHNDRLRITLEESLKKALTEFLILTLLSEREHYIGELTLEIDRRSSRTIHIEFPYSTIYRISNAGYIKESEKRTAPDGRLRQYYKITKKGVTYLAELKRTYYRFINGVLSVLENKDNE